MLVRVSRLMRGAIVIPAALALSAAAASAAVFPADSSAAASSPIPTRLLITISPQPVTPPSPQLTITGTLETRVANGQTPQPIAGEHVSVGMQSVNGGVSQPLGTFITGANGQFSTTVTAQVPGLVQGGFAGDGTYGPAGGVAPIEPTAPLPTKVTVEPITPVPYGSRVSVTALVTMQLPDGTWVPAPGSPIRKYLAYDNDVAVVVLSVPVFWSNAKIVRKGSIRYLTGAIRYLPRGGFLHGVKVRLMIKVSGEIGYGPTITTGAGGTFSFRLAAPKRGQQVKYAVSFAGGKPPAWTAALRPNEDETGRAGNGENVLRPVRPRRRLGWPGDLVQGRQRAAHCSHPGRSDAGCRRLR